MQAPVAADTDLQPEDQMSRVTGEAPSAQSHRLNEVSLATREPRNVDTPSHTGWNSGVGYDSYTCMDSGGGLTWNVTDINQTAPRHSS